MGVGGKQGEMELNGITFSESGVWKGRSKQQKCLVAFTVIFFLLAVAFFIAFLVVILEKDSEDTSSHAPQAQGDVCITHNCLQTAAYLSNNVDPTVDPCQDFYRFACGRWRDTHKLKAGDSKVDNFWLADDKNKNILRSALMANDPNATAGVSKMRAYFRACEDTEAIDARGVQPLKDLLKTGGDNLFPTLTPLWTDEGWTFPEIVERMGSVGNLQTVPAMLLQVTVDKADSAKVTFEFDQISMTLMTTHVYTGDRDSPILKWYENVYTEMLTLLGAKEDTARQDAVDVVDFEVELAKILDPPEQKLNLARNYNNMTVGKMLDRYPQFDWRGLLQRYSSEANILITDDTEVVNMAVNYYDKLFPLIANTSTRTLLNYGMWKIAFTYASQSSSDVRNIKEPLLNALLGITKIPSRWRQCVEEMLVYFPEEMGRLYVESRGFTAGAKQKAEEIIENLRATFKQTLQATDWLTDSTKKAALEKLEYMSEKVGYPEYSMNDTWFDEQFENLNISDGTYLENTVNTVVFSRIQDTELLKKPLDKGRWVLSPASVNAFYSPQFNEMILPASILQAPFFDDMFPDVINYAAIGSVIGHEITHGYDFTGRGFDKYGNLASWWKMEDVEKFTDKAECIVLQYGNFSDPVLPLKVNGHTTLGENLADNRGVRESYRAYRKAIAQRGEEDGKLPALPYTPDQLFFIGYAQTWCGKFEDDYRQLLLLTDMHSPHRFRVNGVVQNNKDFARAFNCPKAAPMNPDKKCTVW